jgi:hypothetical protein
VAATIGPHVGPLAACLPAASGALPAGGPRPLGPLGLSQRGSGPHRPHTLGKPTWGSPRSCQGAAGTGGSTQGVHVADSATPPAASTQGMRGSFFIRGKEAGGTSSFTAARRTIRGVRYRLTRSTSSTSGNQVDASDTHDLRDVVLDPFGCWIRGPLHGGPIGVAQGSKRS